MAPGGSSIDVMIIFVNIEQMLQRIRQHPTEINMLVGWSLHCLVMLHQLKTAVRIEWKPRNIFTTDLTENS